VDRNNLLARLLSASALTKRLSAREGTKLVDMFNKTLDIPVRIYEVYSFGTAHTTHGAVCRVSSD
jgi:hypothetical protein